MTSQKADPSLAPLLEYFRTCVGHRLSAQRLPGMEAGVRRLLAKHRLEAPGQLLHRVVRQPAAFDELAAELLVTETYFFREPAQFEAVRRVVLPDLLRQHRPEHRLQVWSAGCATGEEAYSIAALLDEENLAGRSDVPATDLSGRALARAREGVYSDWSLRGASGGARMDRCFRREGSRWRIVDRFRQAVRFGRLNLVSDDYPQGPFDLIVCRNVLIYFEDAAVRHVADRLYACLAPGGWLVLGPSDPPVWSLAPYETVLTDAGVLYRRGDGAAAGRSRQRAARPATPCAPSPAAASKVPIPRPKPAARTAQAAPSEPPITAERARKAAELGDSSAAERVVAEAARADPTSAELHHLHAALLLDLGRLDAAALAARRAIFLDRSLVVAHLTLGAILQRAGRLEEALRALERAERLCAAGAPERILPLSDGESAGQLLQAVRKQRAHINGLAPEVT